MRLLPTIAISTLVALLVFYLVPTASISSTKTETAAERVLRTGILRCGYTPWDPVLRIDPNDKKISGLAYDVVEAMGAYLGLKVEWTTETGWGEFTEALKTGRIDAFCASGFPNAERARVTLVTQPFLYMPMVAAVRQGDSRFDKDATSLNQPNVRIGSVDGSSPAKISHKQYPNADHKSYPEIIPLSQILMDIGANKIDAALLPKSLVDLYRSQHPGQIKILTASGSGRMHPVVLFVGPQEERLRDILNIALGEVQDTGVVARAIAKHQSAPGTFVPVATPYQIAP